MTLTYQKRGRIRIKTGCESCLEIMWLDPFDVDGVDGIHSCYDAELMVRAGDMGQDEFDEKLRQIVMLRDDFANIRLMLMRGQ